MHFLDFFLVFLSVTLPIINSLRISSILDHIVKLSVSSGGRQPQYCLLDVFYFWRPILLTQGSLLFGQTFVFLAILGVHGIVFVGFHTELFGGGCTRLVYFFAEALSRLALDRFWNTLIYFRLKCALLELADLFLDFILFILLLFVEPFEHVKVG